ncbi:MAG: hypothetical protein H0X46_09840 [Bacteroidetes bacterium]|nr:hypothetical protein [Bacteroidota bacterium]
MKAKEIKTKNVTILLLRPGIIENIIHDYATLEKEDILEIKQINKQLAGGMPYVVLIDSGSFTDINKEARELLSSREFGENTIAKALFVRSLGHRIVAQFYIRINKPYIKTKIFADREKAIDWLDNELKNNRDSL